MEKPSALVCPMLTKWWLLCQLLTHCIATGPCVQSQWGFESCLMWWEDQNFDIHWHHYGRSHQYRLPPGLGNLIMEIYQPLSAGHRLPCPNGLNSNDNASSPDCFRFHQMGDRSECIFAWVCGSAQIKWIQPFESTGCSPRYLTRHSCASWSKLTAWEHTGHGEPVLTQNDMMDRCWWLFQDWLALTGSDVVRVSVTCSTSTGYIYPWSGWSKSWIFMLSFMPNDDALDDRSGTSIRFDSWTTSDRRVDILTFFDRSTVPRMPKLLFSRSINSYSGVWLKDQMPSSNSTAQLCPHRGLWSWSRMQFDPMHNFNVPADLLTSISSQPWSGLFGRDITPSAEYRNPGPCGNWKRRPSDFELPQKFLSRSTTWFVQLIHWCG